MDDGIYRIWCWLGFHDIFTGQRLYGACHCPSIRARLWDAMWSRYATPPCRSGGAMRSTD